MLLENRGMTRFQMDVLMAAMDIPRGKIATYKDIARKIGRPNAYRAVGNALNRNPYPVEIPCHRVVRSDGSVGGYRQGEKRKRTLLKREHAL